MYQVGDVYEVEGENVLIEDVFETPEGDRMVDVRWLCGNGFRETVYASGLEVAIVRGEAVYAYCLDQEYVFWAKARSAAEDAKDYFFHNDVPGRAELIRAAGRMQLVAARESSSAAWNRLKEQCYAITYQCR